MRNLKDCRYYEKQIRNFNQVKVSTAMAENFGPLDDKSLKHDYYEKAKDEAKQSIANLLEQLDSTSMMTTDANSSLSSVGLRNGGGYGNSAVKAATQFDNSLIKDKTCIDLLKKFNL